MEKIRYMGLCSNGVLGGATTQQSWVMQSLDRDRFAPVSVQGPGEFLRREMERHSIPYHVIEPWDRSVNPANDLYVLNELRKLMREHRPDLLHVRTIKGQLLGRLAAMLEKVPVVFYTSHGFLINSARAWWVKRIDLSFERYLQQCTDVQIAVCENDRAAALQYGIAEPEEIVTVLNGVVTEKFSANIPRRAELRENLGLADDDLAVVWLGRFAWPKHPELMINAFAEAAKHSDRLKLIMIGDGPLYEDAGTLVGRLDLQDRVELLGRRDDVEEILPAGDIFAMSSRYEGLPLAMLEAMASGLPVVVPEVGGISEVVAHGVNGFLYTEGEEHSLTELILRLSAKDAMRKQMGATNAELAAAELDYSRVISDHMALYEDAIERWLS